MKKTVKITLVLVMAVIIISLLSCSSSQSSTAGPVVDQDISAAIEDVKESLTSGVSGNFEAVRYENGYVVNFDDSGKYFSVKMARIFPSFGKTLIVKARKTADTNADLISKKENLK